MNHSLSTELRYFKEFCLILMKTPDVNNIAKIFKSMENGKVPLPTITDILLFSRNVCNERTMRGLYRPERAALPSSCAFEAPPATTRTIRQICC